MLTVSQSTSAPCEESVPPTKPHRAIPGSGSACGMWAYTTQASTLLKRDLFDKAVLLLFLLLQMCNSSCLLGWGLEKHRWASRAALTVVSQISRVAFTSIPDYIGSVSQFSASFLCTSRNIWGFLQTYFLLYVKLLCVCEWEYTYMRQVHTLP